MSHTKKHNQEHGFYPEQICAGHIHLNTKNRAFCTRNNVRLSDKRLGGAPQDAELRAAHKQQLCADQRRRNEMEGGFGSGKRKYCLDLMMARVPKGVEALTSMAFVVIGLRGSRGSYGSFLSPYVLGSMPGKDLMRVEALKTM
jgi:hypothetical protein